MWPKARIMAPTATENNFGFSPRSMASASATFITIWPAIDHVGIWGGAGGDFVSSLALAHAPLVAVGQIHRANLATVSAVDAAVHVNIARLPAKRDTEVTGLALYIDNTGIRQDFNVGMLVVLDVGGGNGRPRTTITVIGGAPAKDTIVLGKHETQLGHPPAKAGGLLNQIHS